jgi:hypothetical protein
MFKAVLKNVLFIIPGFVLKMSDDQNDFKRTLDM